MATIDQELLFPKLDAEEMDALRKMGTSEEHPDGTAILNAGDANIDLYVCESGCIDILNPADDNKLIVGHKDNQFVGDIDLLTGRPVIVNAVTHGPHGCCGFPVESCAKFLTRVPRLGEKLLNAAIARRTALSEHGVLGLRVVGPGRCKDTVVVREFLYKNFVPFTWFDTAKEEGKSAGRRWGRRRRRRRFSLGTGGCW